MNLATCLCNQSDGSHRLPVATKPLCREALSGCLIVGTHTSTQCSGLSSLALQFAVNTLSASESAAQVVYLCREQVLLQRPPVLAPTTTEQESTLNRVNIRYLASHVEVQQYSACVHMLQPPPAAIVVHGLSSFFPPGLDRRDREIHTARTLAALKDAAMSIKHHTGRPCPLLVTEEVPESGGADTFHLLHRWLPLVLEVTGRGAPDWCLSLHPVNKITRGAACVPDDQLSETKIHYRLGDTLQMTY